MIGSFGLKNLMKYDHVIGSPRTDFLNQTN